VSALRSLALEVRAHIAQYGDDAFDDVCWQMDSQTITALASCWQTYARHNQMRPEMSKPIWLVSAGRGFGKTRLAAEEVLDVCEDWGDTASIVIASKTIGDVRKVMIGGESGLLSCAERRGYQMRYVPSHSMVYHPGGAILYLVTSEKPDMARGLQCNYFWLDEISSWQNAVATFNNILFSWRLPCPGGKRGIITTTPKQNAITQFLFKKMDTQVTLTFGTTRDNDANLDVGTVDLLESLYKGTKLGRQELDGELLEGQGVCVEQDTIHMHRRTAEPADLVRRIVSLDPCITHGAESDAAGIFVIGVDSQPVQEAYILADRTLETASFQQWAQATVEAFVDFGCDCVIAEVNQGGSGIADAIQIEATRMSQRLGYEVVVPVNSIWARKSKRARAEPVGALYERGRIHHVGHYPALEAELTEWIPGMESPNRMDAVVHGVSHLLLGDKQVGPIGAYLK